MSSSNDITEATRTRIDLLFDAADRTEVEQLLVARCGVRLPMMEAGTAAAIERIRFAVLKLSHGQVPLLERTIAQAEVDWRDVLMAAGFGHDTEAHLAWMPNGG